MYEALTNDFSGSSPPNPPNPISATEFSRIHRNVPPNCWDFFAAIGGGGLPPAFRLPNSLFRLLEHSYSQAIICAAVTDTVLYVHHNNIYINSFMCPSGEWTCYFRAFRSRALNICCPMPTLPQGCIGRADNHGVPPPPPQDPPALDPDFRVGKNEMYKRKHTQAFGFQTPPPSSRGHGQKLHSGFAPRQGDARRSADAGLSWQKVQR